MRPVVCAWRPSTTHVCGPARLVHSFSWTISKGIHSGSDPNGVPNRTRKVPPEGRIGEFERIRTRGGGREEIPGTDLADAAEDKGRMRRSSVGNGMDDVSVSRGTGSRRGRQIASRGCSVPRTFRKTGHRPLRDTSSVRGGT